MLTSLEVFLRECAI